MRVCGYIYLKNCFLTCENGLWMLWCYVRPSFSPFSFPWRGLSLVFSDAFKTERRNILHQLIPQYLRALGIKNSPTFFGMRESFGFTGWDKGEALYLKQGIDILQYIKMRGTHLGDYFMAFMFGIQNSEIWPIAIPSTHRSIGGGQAERAPGQHPSTHRSIGEGQAEHAHGDTRAPMAYIEGEHNAIPAHPPLYIQRAHGNT